MFVCGTIIVAASECGWVMGPWGLGGGLSVDVRVGRALLY